VFLRHLLLASIFCCPALLAAQSDFHELDFAAGKALFDRNWVPAPASTTSADGLGPHYSARSCLACHPRAGRGEVPAGFSLHLDDPIYGKRLQPFSITGARREAALSWEAPVAEAPEPEAGMWRYRLEELAHGAPQSAVSLRLAPSLLGLGLLEAVPVSALQALADPDDRDGDGISGRLAQLPDGRIGRFGWKATGATLQEQLTLALALDLGLSSEALPAPWGDCTEAQQDCRTLALDTVDTRQPLEADATTVKLMQHYLSRLPPPAAPVGEEGATLFAALGCAGCHVPALPSPLSPLGEVAAYTDLLLHDLGEGLDDGLAEGAAAADEWRTAPLWGLGESGPFLHDGRARTLDEALHWHGGEASASRAAWQALDESGRAALSAFLFGL